MGRSRRFLASASRSFPETGDSPRRLEKSAPLAEALAQPAATDFDFDPPRVGGAIFKPADPG
jgi:hypothetical protein